MSFDDWILALHVLSAFAYVAGVVLSWVLVVAVRGTDTPDGTIRMVLLPKLATLRSIPLRDDRWHGACGERPPYATHATRSPRPATRAAS